ncbi:MAG TPA: PAS domain-containing protein, partial [Chitinophagaceae bacterium]
MQSSLYLLQDMMRKKRTSPQGLMQAAPFGYMWVTLNTQKLVASHTIYSLLEKEPYEEFFTVESWRSNVHPKDLYKLLQAEEELMHGTNPVSIEYRMITEKGRHIFVQHNMILSGQPNMTRRITSLVQDITEQKSAEIILEAMNESFFELDKDHVFRRINEHAVKFWQLEERHAVGKHLTDIFPQLEGTPFYSLLVKAQTQKTSLAQDVLDPVTNHWLHLSVTPYDDGLIVIFYDVQHEKEADKEVLQLKDQLAKKATDKYLSLFNSIDEGFCIVEVLFDEKGMPYDYRFLEANNSFEKQTGLINVIGKAIKELAPGHEQHWFDIYGRIARTGEPERFENAARSIGHYYDVYAFRVDDPEENHVAILFNDITESNNVRDALRKSEQKLQSSVDLAKLSPFEWDPATGELNWDWRCKA